MRIFDNLYYLARWFYHILIRIIHLHLFSISNYNAHVYEYPSCV